jgi:hypothetical protein
MNFNLVNMKENFDAIIDGNLRIQCVTITLTQQVNDKPIVYKCIGEIFSNNPGAIEFEAIWSPGSEEKLFGIGTSSLATDLAIGTVIPKEAYFHMEAVSMEGFSWTASNIWLSADIYFTTKSALLKGKISSLSKTSTRSTLSLKSSYAIYAAWNERDFPTNDFTDMGEDGKIRNIFKITLEKFEVSVTKHKGCVEVFFESEKSILLDDAKTVIKAIEIISGRRFRTLIVTSSEPMTISTTLYSNHSTQDLSPLPPSIQLSGPTAIKNCQNFINRFLLYNRQKAIALYKRWAEIAIARDAGIESFSTSLCINLEGIVKEHYVDQLTSDPAFVDECKSAISVIEKINPADGPELLPARVINRICQNLQNAGSPSTKNALYKIFIKELADHWNSIRHTALHGNISKLLMNSQNLLDSSYSCFFMFNEVLMACIGYSEERIDYSEKGYPVVGPKIKLNPVNSESNN